MGKIAGRTVLADEVIETIAGVAAREVHGVHRLGKGKLRSRLAKIAGQDTAHGVDAEVGSKEVAIDLDMIIEFGHSIPDVTSQIRNLVAERINQMTGLVAKEININVVDIFFEGEEVKRRVE